MFSTPINQLIEHPFITGALLFAAVLLAIEAGRRIGIRRRLGGKEDAPGLGAIEGIVFALLGLIIAFSFSGAAQRFDARRDLIVNEANAIGTAQLRIDLLPAASQPAMHDAFNRYIASRIAAYERIANPDAFRAAVAESTLIQREIWGIATAAGRRPDALPSANMLLLPALNEMFDISAARAFATLMHPPLVIHAMLIGLALVASLLLGIGLSPRQRRAWLHPVSFALVLAGIIYVIIDLEYPRAGLIRIDSFEDAVVRTSLKPQ